MPKGQEFFLAESYSTPIPGTSAPAAEESRTVSPDSSRTIHLSPISPNPSFIPERPPSRHSFPSIGRTQQLAGNTETGSDMSIRILENQLISALSGILARTLLLEEITGHKKPGQQSPTSSFLRGPPGPLFFCRLTNCRYRRIKKTAARRATVDSGKENSLLWIFLWRRTFFFLLSFDRFPPLFHIADMLTQYFLSLRVGLQHFFSKPSLHSAKLPDIA